MFKSRDLAVSLMAGDEKDHSKCHVSFPATTCHPTTGPVSDECIAGDTNCHPTLKDTQPAHPPKDKGQKASSSLEALRHQLRGMMAAEL